MTRGFFKNRKFIFILFALGAISLLIVARMRSKEREMGLLSQPAKKGTIVESVYGIGTVTARRSFQLKSGVPSTIRKLYVKEGDTVRRGDKLVDVQSTSLFTAPFDGTVTWLPFKEGETVFAGSGVLTLTDLRDRYIIVSLEQRGALRVRPNQKARVSFDSIREESFTGTVESVYSNENNFLVRIGVAELPPQILPGMTADVSISIAERNGVLLVPVAAIDAGKVRVKRGRVETSVEIKTGAVDGAFAELLSGDVSEGDIFVYRKKGTP